MASPTTPLRMKVDGKWMEVSEDVVLGHPGGPVIRQYLNSDATHMFHAFHEGSSKAYKQLEALKKNGKESEEFDRTLMNNRPKDQADVNISAYDVSIEKEMEIVKSFERLKQRVSDEGLLEANHLYFFFKSTSTVGILFFAFFLQYHEQYLLAALVQALAWQQFGWLTHEYCHHQPSKNRRFNDIFGLVFGNFAQGFSRDWWKDKHNTHHAATNMIGHDGDIDLAPLIAFIPADLMKYKLPLEKLILKIVPYQHLYFTATLPLLRLSWTTQSASWVLTEHLSEYRQYKKNSFGEQISLLGHWTWVLVQLYMLPSMWVRLWFFLITQFLSGLMIGGVVTFNHNSVDKYPANSRLLNNFACLQILTTRNMTPSPFTDWFWGGLNYQIEHHLFPTMPRCNLTRCMKLVKEFCKENDLPYLVNDYWEGYALNLKQLENISDLITTNLKHE